MEKEPRPMKRKHKIYLRRTILLLIIYIGLLIILCISEYNDSTATIHSFRDAFWYSLVTLTTVGYGTGGGRRLSFAFRRYYDDIIRRRHVLCHQRRASALSAWLSAEKELVLFRRLRRGIQHVSRKYL